MKLWRKKIQVCNCFYFPNFYPHSATFHDKVEQGRANFDNNQQILNNDIIS